MKRNDFRQMLQRYLDGECSQEEKRLIDYWYETLETDEVIEKNSTDWLALEEKLWTKIENRTLEETKVIELKSRQWAFVKIGIAATITILVGIGWWFFSGLGHNSTKNTMLVYHNETRNPKQIILEDGSSVVLNPNAKIELKKHFDTNQREVFLMGDALFDIKRNPERPFLVRTGEIITKVLGTKFWIKSSSQSKDVKVTVIEGKVRVFKASNTNLETQADDAALLTSNLEVTYLAKEERLMTSISAEPILIDKEKSFDFEFNDTPLSEVMSRLSEAYGVKIVLANDDILECPLTANLNNLNLYEKLDLICQTLNETKYEVIRTTILVSGKGCN